MDFLTGKYHDVESDRLRYKYDSNLRPEERGNKVEVQQTSHLQAENLLLKKQLAEQQERLDRIEKMLLEKENA